MICAERDCAFECAIFKKCAFGAVAVVTDEVLFTIFNRGDFAINIVA